jgi:hypothetical protein
MGPRVINEPELRWPIYLIAGIITIFIVALTAAVLYLSLNQPSIGGGEEPRLERASRVGAPLFEPLREQSLVKQVVTTEDLSSFNGAPLEMHKIFGGLTPCAVSGPEIREAAVDGQMSASPGLRVS